MQLTQGMLVCLAMQQFGQAAGTWVFHKERAPCLPVQLGKGGGTSGTTATATSVHHHDICLLTPYLGYLSTCLLLLCLKGGHADLGVLQGLSNLTQPLSHLGTGGSQ
jgi:hypothetical protein